MLARFVVGSDGLRDVRECCVAMTVGHCWAYEGSTVGWATYEYGQDNNIKKTISLPVCLCIAFALARALQSTSPFLSNLGRSSSCGWERASVNHWLTTKQHQWGICKFTPSRSPPRLPQAIWSNSKNLTENSKLLSYKRIEPWVPRMST